MSGPFFKKNKVLLAVGWDECPRGIGDPITVTRVGVEINSYSRMYGIAKRAPMLYSAPLKLKKIYLLRIVVVSNNSR